MKEQSYEESLMRSIEHDNRGKRSVKPINIDPEFFSNTGGTKPNTASTHYASSKAIN